VKSSRVTPLPVEIPAVVIDRLPLYARALSSLEKQDIRVVSSQELGSMLGVTPAQIRKDLSYFGRFGKQGRGYNVTRLADELRQILGLNRQWSMVLVGVGSLGEAVLAYDGFLPEGFLILDAFDADEKKVGRKIRGTLVRHVSELPGYLEHHAVDIGIVAVPAAAAAGVVETLIEGGVRSILNYAPVGLQVPAHVRLKSIDPVLSLESMTFYLKDRTLPNELA
jgi:redox-sensing transcriptional repressor